MVHLHDLPLDLASKPKRGRKRTKLDLIVQAASEVFMEYGYGAATTDTIQVRAGVSKSTLYTYFRTKEELFETVCHRRCEAFQTMLESAVHDETDPRSYLEKFGIEFLTFLFSEEGKAFFRHMIAETQRFPHLGKVFYGAGVKASCDMIERFLAKAHQEGSLEVEWPAVSSEHFMGMLRGDFHLRVVMSIGRPPTQEQIGRYVAATVENFLRAHRPRGVRESVTHSSLKRQPVSLRT